MARAGKPFGLEDSFLGNGNIWGFVRLNATLIVAVFLIAFGAILSAVLSHHDSDGYLADEARDAERYAQSVERGHSEHPEYRVQGKMTVDQSSEQGRPGKVVKFYFQKSHKEKNECQQPDLVQKAAGTIHEVLTACKGASSPDWTCTMRCQNALNSYQADRCVAAVMALRTDAEQEDLSSVQALSYEMCFHSKCQKPQAVQNATDAIKSITNNCRSEADGAAGLSMVRCTPSCRQALTAYDYSPCAPWAVEQLQMPKDEKEMFWEMHSWAYDACFASACEDPQLIHNATVAVKGITKHCQTELASDDQIDCSTDCRAALMAYEYAPCASWAVEKFDLPDQEKKMFWDMHKFAAQICWPETSASKVQPIGPPPAMASTIHECRHVPSRMRIATNAIEDVRRSCAVVASADHATMTIDPTEQRFRDTTICPSDCRRALGAYSHAKCTDLALELHRDIQTGIQKRGFLRMHEIAYNRCFETICRSVEQVHNGTAAIKLVVSSCGSEADAVDDGANGVCSQGCIDSLVQYDKSRCAPWAMTNLDIPVSEKELFWKMYQDAYTLCSAQTNVLRELPSARSAPGAPIQSEFVHPQPAPAVSPYSYNPPPAAPPRIPLQPMAPPPISSYSRQPPPYRQQPAAAPAGVHEECATNLDAQQVASMALENVQADCSVLDAACTESCEKSLQTFMRAKCNYKKVSEMNSQRRKSFDTLFYNKMETCTSAKLSNPQCRELSTLHRGTNAIEAVMASCQVEAEGVDTSCSADCRTALERYDMMPCSAWAVDQLPVKASEKKQFWQMHAWAYRACFHPECVTNTKVMSKATVAVSALLANCELNGDNVMCSDDCKHSRLLFDLTQCTMVAVQRLSIDRASTFWKVINRTDRQCSSG